jgi:hypothetical protein
MYTAFCPEFCASRKMRPEVVSVSFPLVVIQGTCQVGWVTNEWVLDEPAAEPPCDVPATAAPD